MNNKPLIIILIVIIGLSGLYYSITGEIPLKSYIFSDRAEEEVIVEDNSLNVDQQTEGLSNQGKSDSVSDIEKDISATDLDALDRELLDIEKELGQL